MAHWIIEDMGFVGTNYTCSECGKMYNDIFTEIDIDGDCPGCGAHMDEDEAEAEYVEETSKPSKLFDRFTSLSILKEFSRDMYPSYDLFGHKTLVINRDKFEAIRKKYLDGEVM